MAVKKGSKNNIANRGARAKIKAYKGQRVKPVRLIDKKGGTAFIAAQYEGGDLVVNPAGEFVKFATITEIAQDQN
jgi:hypothetical protein